MLWVEVTIHMVMENDVVNVFQAILLPKLEACNVMQNYFL